MAKARFCHLLHGGQFTWFFHEDKIIGLYGLGMSLRDISGHIKETYDTDISAATLSSITDKVIPLVKEWQQRPLESLYCIVWLDAMYYKVKEEGRTQTRCVYNILGINKDGRKDVLGMYISQSEGANFWLSVITDLKQRGIEDILIACIDNLKGFDEAIRTIFPLTEVQTCIIHQIRMVKTGIAENDAVEITSGLTAGDIVVTSGAYLLNSEYIFEHGADPMAGMKM